MLLFTFVVSSVALASNIVKEFKPADSNNFALDSQWYTQGDVGNWPDQLQKDKSQLSWFSGNDDGQRFRQLATSNNTVKALNKVWWDEKHPENPTAGVTFYYSDYLTKYIDDVDALKTIAARYGPKMAQFCKERLGQYVGDGLCGALTAAAQKAVGAVEGREITVMKINDGKIVWQADEIRQGDLVLTPEHVQLVDTVISNDNFSVYQQNMGGSPVVYTWYNVGHYKECKIQRVIPKELADPYDQIEL